MGKFDKEKFNKVIEDALAGLSVGQIMEKELVSKRTVSEYISKLSDETSIFYDKDKAEAIMFIREAKFGEFFDKDLLDSIVSDLKMGYPVLDVALRNDVSESLVHKYLRALKDEKHLFYDLELSNELDKIRSKYAKMFVKLGGQMGTRGRIRSLEDIRRLAYHIIDFNATLIETSMKYDIPVSTLYENVKAIGDLDLQDELDKVFASHRQRL